MAKIIKWNTLESKTLFDNYYCKIVKEKVKTSRGIIIPEYFLISKRNVVMIVPLTKKGKFVFIKEYKHGIKEEALLFPAGLVKENEESKITARRELREETGFIAKKLEFLGKFYEYPSNDTHKVYVFLAKGLPEKPQTNPGVSEETKLIFLQYKEVENLIFTNEIKLATAISAVFLAHSKL